MEDKDRNKLGDLLILFFETFGGGANEVSIRGYEMALEDYDYYRIEKSIFLLIKNWIPKYGTKRPSPAEIIESMPTAIKKDLKQIAPPPPISKEQAKINIARIKDLLANNKIG